MTTIAFLRSQTTRPFEEVLEIVEFAIEQTGGIEEGKVAVWVKPGGGNGRAHDRRIHKHVRWSKHARYGISLTTVPDDYVYGVPRACWHSRRMRELRYELGGSAVAVYAHIGELYDAGQRRLGRWPIYLVNDWQEHLLHLAAHEIAHVLQWDRGRGASEVFCEVFAERALEAWRQRVQPTPALA